MEQGGYCSEGVSDHEMRYLEKKNWYLEEKKLAVVSHAVPRGKETSRYLEEKKLAVTDKLEDWEGLASAGGYCGTKPNPHLQRVVGTDLSPIW